MHVTWLHFYFRRAVSLIPDRLQYYKEELREIKHVRITACNNDIEDDTDNDHATWTDTVY